MKVGKLKISRFREGLTVFKPDYYLNEGKKIISDLLDKGIENKTLAEISSKIYQGGIFKRVFNKEGEKAHKYITASDMVKIHPLDTAKDISKKFTPWVTEMTLKNNQILISCAGSVGNVVLVNDSYSGSIGSQEIIRVEDTSVPFGYLYAYLSTPIVYNYIQSMIYGAVIPRISPEEIGKLPVLLTDKAKQQEIHNLIVEASSLRVEANKLLNEAMEYFNSLKIDYKYGTAITRKISISGISNGYKRFDSAYAIVSKLVEDSLQSNQIDYVTIRSQSSGIFIGPRAKRNYVTSGTPFLSTSAMQKANPTKVDKFISPKSSDGFLVEEGWILTTRSGTLGDTIYTLPCISGFAVSEDAIRVVLKEDALISNEYLFAFLKSSIGKSSLLSGSYGSVILHLNENYIGDIKVPILAKEIIEEIEAKVGQHLKNINEAILKENQAIDLVEKEIESWQK
jgi:type I restriction enzyme S subunit